MAGLLRPDAYPDGDGPVRSPVELIETHISYLFLTGQHVYKVKKPVDLGFLDFTTLGQRKRYCLDEVALNRRLSPDVYLGVEEVKLWDGRYFIGGPGGGPGETVEYAVKMRQLPQDRALSKLVKAEMVGPEDIRRLARHIARFHEMAAHDDEIARLGGIEKVRRNVEENFAQAEGFVGLTIQREAMDDVKAYSRAFLTTHEGLLRERGVQGRIRDCHGDLHAAQIFLEDGPEGEKSKVSCIDCIEFNERFRYSDVAEDVAFLAMDLDFHQRADLSRLMIDEYAQAADDPGVHRLVDFFKSYRAFVRGKVHSLQLEQSHLSPDSRRETIETAQAYFRLAHSYTQIFPRPALIILSGLTGVGKSTLATELARRWDLEYVSSDVTRKGLAGAPPSQRMGSPFETGIYSEESTHRTYESILDRAQQFLKEGKSVVLDATFRHSDERLGALSLAREASVPAYLVELTLDEAEAKARLDERSARGDSVSDAGWEVYRQQKLDWEPVSQLPSGRYIKIDNSGLPEASLEALLVLLMESALE